MTAPGNVDDEQFNVGIAQIGAETLKRIAVVKMRPFDFDLKRPFETLAKMILRSSPDKNEFASRKPLANRQNRLGRLGGADVGLKSVRRLRLLVFDVLVDRLHDAAKSVGRFDFLGRQMDDYGSSKRSKSSVVVSTIRAQ